ncbi:MAG: TetR/AcrR family transcriptional regulator [Pseudomonadota bacterium]
MAARAGLSEGALYRHFKGKDAIALHLFTAIHEKLSRLVRTAGASASTIDAQADAIVDAYCATADDDWALFSYHMFTTPRFLPTPPGGDDPVTATEDIVRAAMARGDIPSADPVILSAMALGVVLQPALHKAYGRLDGPLADHAETFKAGVKRILHQQPSA